MKWGNISNKMKKILSIRNRIPSTPKDWIEEISKAYLDAFEAIPFGKFVGQKINPEDLFKCHLFSAT
jgi:hypothetical protein